MGKRKHNISAEARAQSSARMKALWATNREKMLEQARRGIANRWKANGRKLPERGTEARRTFEKIARNSNAATAHAWLEKQP